jgi:uncharacterized protein
VEVAVVVLPSIGQLVPKDFAVALFQHWGIGKAGKDNGLLVLHILDQRRIEIETGYGMEGILPDVKCFWITEGIAVPFFKASSFADGHYEVVRALIRGIEQPEIKQVDLLSPWITKPGDSVQSEPDVVEYDAIALAHMPVAGRAMHSLWPPVIIAALAGAWYVGINLLLIARTRGKEPYAQYQTFRYGLGRWQYAAAVPAAGSALVLEMPRTGTFISPFVALIAVFVGIYVRRGRELYRLRSKEPRICACGQSMQRLSEKKDDEYLEAGHVAEESIDSVDYDVWVCSCGASKIETYAGSASAAKCVKCNYKTYRVSNTRTLTAATTSSSGLREVTQSCAHCGLSKTHTEVIPRISTSSSSSGSRSSSGSFGGGRSGGGGAGSSY